MSLSPKVFTLTLGTEPISLKDSLRDLERTLIEHAIKLHPTRKEAAEWLMIKRTDLVERRRRLGFELGRGSQQWPGLPRRPGQGTKT